MKSLASILILCLSLGIQVQAQTEEELDAEMAAALPEPAVPSQKSEGSQSSSPTDSQQVENSQGPIGPTKKDERSLVDKENEIQKQILKRKNAFEEPVNSDNLNRFPKKDERSLVDRENEIQKQILKRKTQFEEPVSSDRSLNRFPKKEPSFKLPPGPREGGTVRLDHPRAAEGLLKINKDGTYQYKTAIKDKSQSTTIKVSSLTPPVISSSSSTVTYQSMYGGQNLFLLSFDYEWQPFHRFGSLGFQFGGGFATSTANGTFKFAHAGRATESEETYNIFLLPISTFLIYRFEFVRRQWIVPFLTGGATYYGMAEIRDDGKAPKLAGAPAVGGGGGALFSISRLDSAGAFTLSQEYGISDMWLVLEARAMQGLYKDIDFTSQSVSAGIAVDF